jgi:hypothetical protein
MKGRSFPVLLSLTLAVLLIPVHSTYAQLEDVIARVKRATVLVEFRDALGGKGHGSGFIYDASGFVLTNHHVVEGAVDLTVKFSDGRSFPATVVDYVRREEFTGSELRGDTDVAVLKIPATGLPVLPRGDSATLRQGEEILILGYPGGVGTEEVTVTRGIVSAVRFGWFQTDASIEPGDSGGPVIDSQGRVMGLATFITGPMRKIGGVVAINGIWDLATSALNPNAQRRNELMIPGLEYVSPLIVPKRKSWRITYDPGKTKLQAYVREYTNEVTDVQNINGAVIFSSHDSRGVDSKLYLDSEGLFITSRWESPLSFSYPRPFLSFPLPPVIGRSWDGEYAFDNAAQGLRGQETDNSRIDSIDEVITVPAGTFSHTIKVLALGQRLVERGSQKVLFHVSITSWLAPQVSGVKTITDIAESGEHIVLELVGSQ